MISLSGQSLYLNGNGILHHVLRYGHPSAPPLLLLPGITSPAASADFIAADLAEMGFVVYVPDLRGRGQTQVTPPGTYRLSHYNADIAALVDALDLDRPILLGHSMGARIAAAYAVGQGAGKVGQVVLVDPPICGPGRGEYPTGIGSFMDQLHEAQSGTTLEAVRRFYPKWPERELQLRRHILPSCNEIAVRDSHANFALEDFFVHWRQLDGTTTLIYGVQSPVVTPDGLADLRAANPDVAFHGVADAGHMVPWDNFDGFMAAVRAALGPRL